MLLIFFDFTKKSFFKFEDRLKIVEEALKDYINIDIQVCKGYVFEFLNAQKIGIIARGYRNDVDLKYENEMSAYNKEHGNIETVLYKCEGKIAEISSTKVREALEKDLTIKGLVPKNIEKLLKKLYEVRIW